MKIKDTNTYEKECIDNQGVFGIGLCPDIPVGTRACQHFYLYQGGETFEATHWIVDIGASDQYWNSPYFADDAFETKEQWDKNICENYDYPDQEGIQDSHVWLVKGDLSLARKK